MSGPTVTVRIVLAIFLLGTWACSKSKDNGNNPTAKPEETFCSTVTTYSSPVTISGTAYYQRRLFVLSGPNSGLGGVDPTLYPIKYAEVKVTDTSGSTIQCGQTDVNGNFAVNVPSSSTASVTIRIAARASNSFIKVSILKDPFDNEVHYISSTTIPDGTKNIGNVIAPATGTLEGGAFNIYDVILRANDFLRAQTLNCNATVSGCVPFSVAPKAKVYWERGYNPGAYIGIPGSPISFYLPGESELYILGGEHLNGTVDDTDTDHFDDSVIAHEYGHFIEDVFSNTDSPGGAHDADSIIDPRLAWGEGWANFMALAINNDPIYKDSFGNEDGFTGFHFNHNLETNDNGRDEPRRDFNKPSESWDPQPVSCTSTDPNHHCPDDPLPASTSDTHYGEGNFREFAITRALWDIIDSDSSSINLDGTDTDDDPTDNFLDSPPAPGPEVETLFAQLWTIFTQDFNSGSYFFRNFGLFMQLRNSRFPTPDVSSVLESYLQMQKPNITDYSTLLNPGTTSPVTMNVAADITTAPGTNFAGRDQFSSDDFYRINHSGGLVQIKLNYTSTVSGVTADLDIYLLKEDYFFDKDSSSPDSADWMGQPGFDPAPADGGDECISVYAPPGQYMLNVNMFTGNIPNGSKPPAAQYTLTLGSSGVCP